MKRNALAAQTASAPSQSPLIAHNFFLRNLLLLLLCLASVPALAQSLAGNALPTGGVVSAGQATISQSGNQMQILQGSDKAALNWQSFNIGSNAGVTFQQPSAQSVALNRVSGVEPSQVFGTLSANGKLILINPNGVVFGAGSRVDAAGLIATTKALSDADFMNNNFHFQDGGSGVVRNDGTLVAAPDGSILLVADKVINTGTMQVQGGTVGMVSAEDLQVAGDWKTANVASSAATAIDTVTVENAGRIDVSGMQGGWIRLEGGQGTTQSSGALLAVGEQGGGGVIHLSGTRVGLMRGSLTNASGATGGGEVLVGGDWQGSGSMAHASATYMDADAVILVNATSQGNGGKAVLWSDGYTNFRGLIHADGAGAGNGGRVETSGENILDSTGLATARGVQAGSWLLDPSDVTITSSPGDPLSGNIYNPTGMTGTISSAEISDALNIGTNVTISTFSAFDRGGVILQNAGADINKTTGGNAILSLIANRIIDLRGNITSNTGELNLMLDASGGAGDKTGAVITYGNLITNGGNITFRSGVMALGTVAQTITTAGGVVNFNGDLEIANPAGLTIDTVTGATNGGGVVVFGGKVDSGDTYSFAPAGSWNDAYNNLRVGNGISIGSMYLAVPQSELENSVVNYRSAFSIIAIGGLGNIGNHWIWANGPISGREFNRTQNGLDVPPMPNGDPTYENWMSGQPNVPVAIQSALGMNAAGQWVTVTGSGSVGGTVPRVDGTVLQRVTATSPLTVHAGTGAVSFGDRVGSFKPLLSLEVTGPTAINGKQVTTEQGQIYNNPVTIGNVTSTLLESTMGSLVLDNPISYNWPGASTLQIVAAQNITLNAPITAIDAPLAVSMTADYKGGGNGAITINDPIETRGGAITLTASTGIELDNQPLTSDGGNITLTNQLSGDISASGLATIDAGSGFIQVINGNLGVGTPGQGKIDLQDLTGGNITVRNAAIGLGVGQNAVTLNRPVTAGGAVLITSLTGDILTEAAIVTTGGSVTIIADQNDSGLGGITINQSVSSAGGAITLKGSSGITAAATAPLDAGTGDISVTNGLAVGNTGSNRTVLHALTGNAITVANNTIALLAGNVAVSLNGPVNASGAVKVTSRTGDITVDNTITTSGTPVFIQADTNTSGAGTILINQPMTTSNGTITLIANSGILAATGADLDAGTGDISATNGTGGGGTGSGVIELQKLTGGAINVSSNTVNLPAGTVAVTIEGEVAGNGFVNIFSNAGSILTKGEISTTGTSVIIQADARATGNGAITVNQPITTQGGRISLTASSGIITSPGAVLDAGGGDITVTNGNPAGTVGSNQIVLHDLTGAVINVSNNVTGMIAGQTAVSLNGPVNGSGAVSVISQTGDILVEGEITSAGTPVTISADTRDTGNGAVSVDRPITTNGGELRITAGSGIAINAVALNTVGGAGGGNLSLTNNRNGNIIAATGTTMHAGGNISVVNGLPAGVTGGGHILLQVLTGNAISVTNNVTGMAAGQNAITLSGPTNGSGAVTIRSLTGDVLVEGDIIGSAMPVAITADANNSGNGAVTISRPVTTTGGAITLTASSGITAATGATLHADGGNISVTNGLANGTTGSNQVVLQDLNGAAITVANNGAGMVAGQNAVTLNGPVTASGAVTVGSWTGDILVAGEITSTGTPVTISADTSDTGNGAVSVDRPITTNGGELRITAGSGIAINAVALNTVGGAGAGNLSLTNNRNGNIIAATGTTMHAGGNISVVNGLPAGVTGGGHILLQALTGNAISVTNNVTGMAAGQNAITLSGPTNGNGAVTIRSLTGDILVEGDITGSVMPVEVTADASNTGNGAVTINRPVTTTGGAITLTASSGITAATGATLHAGGGNISVTNGLANGTTGSNPIVLQGLNGAVITVNNHAATMGAGVNAVALNGPITGNGAVTVASRAGDILVGGGITSAGSGVRVSADTSNTGSGAVTVNNPVTTSGGNIVLSASSGIALTGAPLDATGGTGTGSITLNNLHSGDITASTGSGMNAGGDINVTNGIVGGGKITLQDLNGAAISIANRVTDLAAGEDAVILDGLVFGTGAVLVTSQGGDIWVNNGITSTANGNLSAIIVAASTPTPSNDITGGNVHLMNASTLTVNTNSRAIIYTGSIDNSTGIGTSPPLNTGYPGPGRYRYDVAYNDTSRLQTADPSGVYVQYREQPTLTFDMTQQGKVYDGLPFNGLDLSNYNVTGWKNADSAVNNALGGNVILNGDPNTVAIDVGDYSLSLIGLTNVLGYKLELMGAGQYKITPKLLVVGNFDVADRQYNSKTDATIIGGELIGVENRDIGNVFITNPIAHFEDKNVGVNKTVQVMSADLGGLRKGNYEIHFTGSTSLGTITPAELRLSGIHPLDRVYDGTTNATFTGNPTLSGIFQDDYGLVTAPLDKISGHFANKNAGDHKEVVEDLSTAVLEGPEKDNYVLVGVDHTVNSATIFPALLSVFGTPDKKMFDGTTDSDTTAIVTGLMPGDSVGDVRQVFNNARPGKNKFMLILGGFVIDDGNDGNNYILESGGARGEITNIPMPSGIGSNGATLDSKNLDLLSALIAFDDIRQKSEQANYFLEPGEEPRDSTTHAGIYTGSNDDR